MDIDKPILDFLAEPDNLSMAFEISEYLERLKLELHRGFWETVNGKMGDKENASEVPENWKLALYPLDKIRSSQWKGLYLQPVIKPKPKHFLQIAIAQTSGQGNYTLARGIVWNSPLKEWAHPKFEELTSKLEIDGFSRSDKWWPRWEYYKYQLEGVEFMAKMAKDMNAAVDEVLNEWWDLFLEIRPLMEEVNQAVSER